MANCYTNRNKFKNIGTPLKTALDITCYCSVWCFVFPVTYDHVRSFHQVFICKSA